MAHNPMPTVHYEFPEADLLPTLIDLYFVHWNVLFPLLHRPSFQQAVYDGLHHRDSGFATVLLSVCANAAPFSDDPRVRLPGMSQFSAGWRWFSQVHRNPKSALAPVTLYDLQQACVRELVTHFRNFLLTIKSAYLQLSAGVVKPHRTLACHWLRRASGHGCRRSPEESVRRASKFAGRTLEESLLVNISTCVLTC
jgi:hypothetical protein